MAHDMFLVMQLPSGVGSLVGDPPPFPGFEGAFVVTVASFTVGDSAGPHASITLQCGKQVSRSSASLYQLAATGKQLGVIDLYVATQGGLQLTYRFTDAFLTGVTWSGSTDMPDEALSIDAARVSELSGKTVPAASLRLTGYPSPVIAGESHTFVLEALDKNGQVDSAYLGTVHFTSLDPRAVLPPDYTFTPADGGSHTFDATFMTPGTQTLSATDTAYSGITGSQGGIEVQAASPGGTPTPELGSGELLALGLAGAAGVMLQRRRAAARTAQRESGHSDIDEPAPGETCQDAASTAE